MKKNIQPVPVIDSEREVFKDKVKQFFIPHRDEELENYTGVKVKKLRYTVPALAVHLGLLTDEVVNYTGPYKTIMDFALLQCENYILNSIIDGKIDKSIGLVLLEQYHNYGRRKLAKEPTKKKKSISQLLNEFEES